MTTERAIERLRDLMRWKVEMGRQGNGEAERDALALAMAIRIMEAALKC